MVKTKFFPSFASIYTGKGFDPGGGGGGGVPWECS